MKHTEGEWKQDKSMLGRIGKDACEWIYIKSKDKTLAEIKGRHYGIGHREMIANAKLIASAPELLDACNHQLALMNSMVDEIPEFMRGSKEKLQLAIKKATT